LHFEQVQPRATGRPHGAEGLDVKPLDLGS
jgi:hypothetical protein